MVAKIAKNTAKEREDLLALPSQNIELCQKNYQKLVQKRKMA